MTTAYHTLQNTLRAHPKRWLVTGAAGFIGSHLVETLLKLDQTVVGLDNLSTGFMDNVDGVRALVRPDQAERYTFIEGDITTLSDCERACDGADAVLHQAALGSVPRSIQFPLDTHKANVTGFANMVVAAKEAGIRSFVYASSSSVYGDHPGLPKVEDKIGNTLSPYAASKLTNEHYATAYCAVYDIHMVGLRYFNVMGPRQNPKGAYAAIPRWMQNSLKVPLIFSVMGRKLRFLFVANVVQANLLAADRAESARSSLQRRHWRAYHIIRYSRSYATAVAAWRNLEAQYQDGAGDIKHIANIDKAIQDLCKNTPAGD